MTTNTLGGLVAPATSKAIIVLESGLVVSFDVKTSERYTNKRTVTESKLEIGYKVSDGIVTDTPTIEFEGVITGVTNYLIYASKVFDATAAASAVASIDNAYKTEELASVYTSFNAIPNCVFTGFEVEVSPDKTAFNIKASAKGVNFVSFNRTTGEAPSKGKTKKPAGKGKTNTGKKSAKPATEEKQKQSTLNAIFF
ncbi:TPA: hypothetical protein R4193_002848 [Serratia marcescens]|uniref:phage baseplate protein n=1 Tax=Serratia marcescens TaxID=615 RepID=UPI001C410C99|nr:hypothetical protein [Serratia marcescens]EGT0502890.1 hypothetical protein [Serratia marcescens]MDP8630533.1 hypothetical protein [Serratia marcescens]MDP8749365.1 hypothetical protein [Serratia marcescens]MDP8763664.1 hypothetical protein [Serratia marcescens]HBH7056225.1 hypothetical protein [Serratia marcescens]